MSLPLCGECPDAFKDIVASVDLIQKILDNLDMILDHDGRWTGTIGLTQYHQIEAALQRIKDIAT